MDEKIKEKEFLLSPLAKKRTNEHGSKKMFAIALTTMQDLLQTFLTSNLEMKDHLFLM